MAKPAKSSVGERESARRAATRAAVADTAGAAITPEAALLGRSPQLRGPADPFTGGLRRQVLPMLVLHFIKDGSSYGNRLMEQISEITGGVLLVNPNTMYPLLRQLEADGLIDGQWEHPERRSRRYYSLTKQGEKEYKRLHDEVRPALESIARSLDRIVGEVYADKR